MSGKIHAAKNTTARLRRVLDFLRSRGRDGATTREIVRQADVCAVNTCVSELRTQGHAIDCDMEGVGRFRYRLIEDPQGDLFS